MTVNFPQLQSEMKLIEQKLNQMLLQLTAQNDLQKLQMMGRKRILTFNHFGKTVEMYLPDAGYDLIQRNILRQGHFFEGRVLRQLEEKKVFSPGDIVYDVGANIGNHSVYFSKIMGAGKLVAFEPQPHCYDILKKNVTLNKLCSVVKIEQCMLGDKTGMGEVAHFSPNNYGATRLKESESGTISMTTLDAYAAKAKHKRINFMKIDVEGAAPTVLKGAKRILQEMRPVILVELLPQLQEIEPGLEFMVEMGYTYEKLSRHDFLFTPT
jgi:FkbM family methyltransferase